MMDRMSNRIARIVDENPAYELAIMTMMVYSLPPKVNEIDCLVVFPGMGEEWRMVEAVRVWNENKKIKKFLIGGVHKDEVTYKQITLETLRNMRVHPEREKDIIFQDSASQTNQQTDWVVEQIVKHDLSSVGLLISPYHLLRAYCTLIRSFEKLNIPYARVMPIPVSIAPNVIIPETGVDAWRMAMGEYERIERYRQKGDVATYSEVKDYLNWLWSVPAIE
jgi:hypothetical protein